MQPVFEAGLQHKTQPIASPLHPYRSKIDISTGSLVGLDWEQKAHSNAIHLVMLIGKISTLSVSQQSKRLNNT